MVEWHELEPEKCEADAELRIERACDYYNALMATEGGRRVLFDILEDCHFFDVTDDCPVELAVSRLVQVRTAKRILEKCGVVDRMEFVAAMAGVAREYAGGEETPQEPPNMYDEQELKTP